MGITLTNAHTASRHKEDDWFRVGRDLFLLLSKGEGLVSAGFKGGRTGFGWFQGGKDWFRLVSCGKDWFRLVSAGFGWFRLIPLFSNCQFSPHQWLILVLASLRAVSCC